MKIGLFFGSFNPIHIGHLIIAETMAQSDELEQVWFVVSPHNPFKKKRNLLHEFDRLHMVRLAIADNPQFNVTDVEFRMPQPSYTVDTMVYLSEKYPQHRFRLIIGQDNLKHFPRWKNHEALLDHHGLLVYPRPHASETELLAHPNVCMVEAPEVEISATFIRQAVRQERSIRYLVHPEVADYIHAKSFYQQ